MARSTRRGRLSKVDCPIVDDAERVVRGFKGDDGREKARDRSKKERNSKMREGFNE
jgi:hypothetical protein